MTVSRIAVVSQLVAAADNRPDCWSIDAGDECEAMSCQDDVRKMFKKDLPTKAKPTYYGPETNVKDSDWSECSGDDGWTKAWFTNYESFPQACEGPHQQNDVPLNKEEGKEYGGCKWMGQFAYSKDITYADLKCDAKKNNIIAFYVDDKVSIDGKMENEKYANKKMRLKYTQHGYTYYLDVEVKDTCSDSDTKDKKGKAATKCSDNAKSGGGHLVDVEHWTLQRWLGAAKVDLNNLEDTIQWKICEKKSRSLEDAVYV